MKPIADFHTHTDFSHGKGTIEENVKAAVEKGLKRIAISDHGPGHLGFGINKKKYVDMRRTIDELKEKYDIEIYLSLEANILDVEGNIDVNEEILQHCDMLVAGYHFGSKPTKLVRDGHFHLMNYINKFFKGVEKKAKEVNTLAVTRAMKKYDIDFISHPGAKAPIDMDEVAKVAAETGTALEINNRHGHLTVENIGIAMKYDIDFTMNSDAHKPMDVGTFDNAIKRAEMAGLEETRIINCRENYKPKRLR